MEPTEMQEFAKQMREAGEESLNTISLAIAILAVLVAISDGAGASHPY